MVVLVALVSVAVDDSGIPHPDAHVIAVVSVEAVVVEPVFVAATASEAQESEPVAEGPVVSAVVVTASVFVPEEGDLHVDVVCNVAVFSPVTCGAGEEEDQHVEDVSGCAT